MRFPVSLRWTSYVVPNPSPQRLLKNAKRPISVKNHTSLEKCLLPSFFVWNCLQQSFRAFIDLTIPAKMICRGRPFKCTFYIK